MAEVIPLKVTRTAGDTDGLAEFAPGEFSGVDFGGTGADNPVQAAANLGVYTQAEVDLLLAANIQPIYMVAINGKMFPVYDDTDLIKTLSVSENNFQFSARTFTGNKWLELARANNSNNGYTFPYNATIVSLLISVGDNNSNTTNFNLYIDGVDAGLVATVTGNGNQEIYLPVDLDIDQGEKVRIRGNVTGGTNDCRDASITLISKWRA